MCFVVVDMYILCIYLFLYMNQSLHPSLLCSYVHIHFIFMHLEAAGNMLLVTKPDVAQFDKFGGQSLVFSNQQIHFCRSIFVS